MMKSRYGPSRRIDIGTGLSFTQNVTIIGATAGIVATPG